MIRILTSLAALACLQLQPVKAASVCFEPNEPDDGRGRWAFSGGIAFLTSNDIGEIITGDITIDDSPVGGEIYSLTATRRLGQFKLDLWNQIFLPQLEAPFSVEIVNENSRGSFFNFSASLVLRWEDFPWNHVVSTTIATGVGLSYSEQIYAMDAKKHPTSNRSHVKFNWPIELTLALPDYPEHQLMFFIAHKSGGHIFDEGGVNSVGFGYRFSY